ncbi:MAG: hypothetical protein K0R55_1209 [Sporomusa sp.]|jgi:hypothetical protein|nr:hypothetical protein [Sporomusa sp.]
MRSNFSEYEAVEKVARKFTESVAAGKSEICKPYFYDKAVMFGYLDGKLEQGTIQNLYDNLDNSGSDPAYVSRIDIIAIEETVAIAQVIEDNWGGHDFTDYLLMLKMEDGWKVVAKVYNQNSNTIKK